MRATNFYLDKDIFHPKVLDSFPKIFHMENSIFSLADDVSAKNSALYNGEKTAAERKYFRRSRS